MSVLRSSFTPLFVPIREMGQFCVEDDGLYRIQAPVIPFHIVEVFLHLPMVAYHFDRFAAISGSLVVAAPPSPQAPRFLPG